MAFNTFCFASFCVNLMAINPNLYDLEIKNEYLEYRLNGTVHNYKSLENSLESNVHLAIEMAIHGLVSNASREALETAKGLTEQAKSEGKNVKICSDAFSKMIMFAVEDVVESMGVCLTDIEKKYNDLAYDIRTGIRNTNEVASIVKVLGLNCNGLEDDQEYQCFKEQLEKYMDKHYYLEKLYLEHAEKYNVALGVAEKAIKCIEDHAIDASYIAAYVLRETESCIASI